MLVVTSMKIFRIIVFFAMVALPFYASAQGTYDRELRDLVEYEIKEWIYQYNVIDAILAQNEQHKDITQVDKIRLEKRWQKERRKSDKSFIKRVLKNDLSQYLKRVKLQSKGLYTEIVVIDSYGINVGQSDMSANYWQEGKAKWDETFAVNSYATFIKDVDFDDSTEMFQAEVAFIIIYEDAPIGVAYVGINVEELNNDRQMNFKRAVQ
tara:strand:- start:26 stop:652 length:627 start_codon:yes stop_codon:yes gene_type:complete